MMMRTDKDENNSDGATINRINNEDDSDSKWEWSDTEVSSDIRIAKEEVKKKTKWKCKAGNEQPLREQRELKKRQKCMEVRPARLVDKKSTFHWEFDNASSPCCFFACLAATCCPVLQVAGRLLN
jgi:hypothetical protein